MDRNKWEYKKLGDCFAYIKNGANIKQISGATGIPITRIETLSNDVFNRDRMGYANIDDVSPYSSNILNDGDILMSHINSMKFLGRAVEYKKIDEEVIIHGMNLLRMIPTSNFLSSYAVYQFKTDHFRKQIKAISHQAVNQASFNVTNLKGLNLIVPPVDDQQRIVAELDCLNEMIALKQEQLKEFDKLAQSIFYDMFGDLSINDKAWNMKPFAEIALAKTGITYKPDNVKDSGIIVLRSSNVQEDELAFEDVVRVDLPISEKYHVQNGDILMCSRNGSARLVGKTAKIMNVNEIMTWGAFMTIIRSKYNDYLLQYFKTDTFRNSLTSSKTTTVHQITIGMLNALNIPLPPFALQQQFAEKIQAIEAQKELVKKSIAETQQLLDSRMDYYFD